MVRPALFYFSNTNAVVGPDDPVAVPPGCRMLDFELELAAVIGRPGTDLTPERASDHIAGYTLFNDWSARDLMPPVIPVGLGPVKGKDFANTSGLDRHGRRTRPPPPRRPSGAGDARGGQRRPAAGGGDTSAHMSWSFEEIVAFASRGAELRPGDVLASGDLRRRLPARVLGAPGRRGPAALQPGDVVTLVVEGIGSVSNPVVAGVEPVDLPKARVGQTRRRRPWTSAGT